MVPMLEYVIKQLQQQQKSRIIWNVGVDKLISGINTVISIPFVEIKLCLSITGGPTP